MKNNKAAIALVAFVAVIGVAMVASTKPDGEAVKLADTAPAADAPKTLEATQPLTTAANGETNTVIDASKLEPKIDSSLLSDAPLSTDFTMGDKNAPVVLVEYASLSCSHCARFHNETLPGLTKNYIFTGKLLYILRPFPLNESAMAGSMLTTCMGEKNGSDSYYTFTRVLFDAQSKWAFDMNFKDSLKTFAQVGGVSDKEFEACLNDTDREKKILQGRKDAAEILKVDATPYLFLNGHPHKGGQTFEEISVVIDSMLAEKK